MRLSSTGEPRWIHRVVVDAIHHDLVVTCGGLHGLRDETALESALARPRQLAAYGSGVDSTSLAAAYGYEIARNHPFHDGNKRVAFVVMAVFAELNGHRLSTAEEDVVSTIIALAAGTLSEEELAAWVRECLARKGKASR